jgi:hypothetical protein
MDNELKIYWRKGATSTPICSVWDESVAAKDAQEIALCVNC